MCRFFKLKVWRLFWWEFVDCSISNSSCSVFICIFLYSHICNSVCWRYISRQAIESLSMQYAEVYSISDRCSTVGVACRNGDLELVRSLIQEGKAVDVQDNRGWRPLHEAAKHNHTQCLQLLLQQEARDVNWRTFEGESPLLLAARGGHTDSVRLLLEAGADVNLCSNENCSPVLAATWARNEECVKLLIDGAADVNKQFYCGTTPLIFSAEQGLVSITKILLEHGAKMHLTEEYGISPIFAAAQFGREECLKMLIEKCKQTGEESLVNLCTEDEASPLFMAAQNDYPACVKVLLENGADANASTCEDLNNSLPLTAAVEFEHRECFEMLLPATQKDAIWMGSGNLLYCSIKSSSPEYYVQKAIEAGADVNRRIGFECVCPEYLENIYQHLHAVGVIYEYKLLSVLGYTLNGEGPSLSVAHGIAEMLLGAGANVTPQGKEDFPPLFSAINSASLEIVRRFLQHGAPVNYYSYRSPANMSIVLALHDRAILTLLLTSGAEVKSCFRLETKDMFRDFFDILGILSVYLQPNMCMSPAKIIELLLDFVGNVKSLPEKLERIIDCDSEWRKLKEITENPRPLMHLCRLVIREQFPQETVLSPDALSTLPVPPTVLDYLQYAYC